MKLKQKNNSNHLIREVQLFNLISFVAILFAVILISCAIISYSKIIELRKTAIVSANEIEAFLRDPLFDVDDDQVVRIAETCLLSGKISGIVLESSVTGVLLSRPAGTGSHWIPKITREIYKDDFLLGKFTITFSDEEIYRNIYQLSIVSLIIVIAVFIAFKISNYFFISNRISRSFEPVLSGFASFSAGNYETFIKPTRYMDVNIIVSHFNEMAEKIRQKNSEQKKNREALIAERRYLMDIIDFLPDATFIVDTDKKVVAWNRAAEALTSVPRDRMLGKGDYEYALPFFKKRRPILIDFLDMPFDQSETLYEDIKKTDTALYAEVFTPLVNNGQGAHLWNVAAPLFDQKGNRTGAIELMRDVSDYKAAEKEKHQLQLKLQQVQKMEAIGTLAGGIAHDFNNILSAIIGYVELSILEMNEKGQDVAYLNEIYRAANRAKDLVKQILAFSRQGKQVLEPVSVKLVAKEALNLLRASLPSSIEIEQHLDSDSLVMGDPTQIHQILMNLCTNAAHAIPETGGTMDVEIRDIELNKAITARSLNLKPGIYLKLSISDTGCGISPENMDRIFDPFFTTKGLGVGTGMGLSVVHGIVESIGGRVQVRSEPGKGSTFDVFLPVANRGPELERAVPPVLPRGTERILFVDDEPVLIKVGKAILKTLGYSVTGTTNPEEALELLRAQPLTFDILITDLTMPKMTGDVLARKVAAFRPGFPMILCTGFSPTMTEKRAKEIGIKGFLLKPLIRSEIAKLIRKVLDENNNSSIIPNK